MGLIGDVLVPQELTFGVNLEVSNQVRGLRPTERRRGDDSP